MKTLNPTLSLILFTLAFVLFAVSAYLASGLAERLERLAFACIVLAWIL